MLELKGFHAKYRRYFSQLTRGGQRPLTIQQAADLLEVPSSTAKYILARFARSGWFFRIKQGVYVPVPATLEDGEAFAEDPLTVAHTLFAPCYIGGWDAVSHWDLTDQIFSRTFVYTQTPQKKSTFDYLNHTFIVHKIPKEQFFGLKIVWRQTVKLQISDPSRTIIDFLDAPHLFGGAAPLREVFSEYLKSPHKNIDLLVDYALKMKNRAIVKRLGLLLETEGLMTPDINQTLIENMSSGKAKLIPTLDCPKLITKWQLWVPHSWKKKSP